MQSDHGSQNFCWGNKQLPTSSSAVALRTEDGRFDSTALQISHNAEWPRIHAADKKGN